MSAEYLDTTLSQIRELIARLQAPVPDKLTLLQLLSAPLDHLGLLPPKFKRYNVSPLPSDSLHIYRHIPLLQRALLEHIIPSWEPILTQEGNQALLEQYFFPDAISFTSPSAGQVATLAYSTILSSPLTASSIRILVRLVKSYPIDVLHSVVYSSRNTGASGKQEISWEDCVRNLAAIPAKVANALGGKADVPVELQQGTYFHGLSIRCERLIDTLAADSSRESVSSLTYLLGKLVNVGVFPPSHPTSPSEPSFFQATIPAIRARLSVPNASYAAMWRKLLTSLPSFSTLQSIVTSLLASLADIPSDFNATPLARSFVKREAQLLKDLLGRPCSGNGELLDCFSAVALGREWPEGHARIFACWTAGAEKDESDAEVLSKVVDIWTNPDHIRHSILSRHRYMTSLLLLTLASARPPEPTFQSLAFSPPFIRAISTYISHLDPAVRRCGMLVAEEVARGAGKKLDFGDWDGHGHGRDWCRRLRALMRERDADADVDLAPALEDEAETPGRPARPTVQDAGYDSDDSLTGYASPPASSRSASPTPSELEEIERDPTLRVGQKSVPHPVYLAQLGELVRSTSGVRSEQEDMQAQKHEVALNVAEELIRRKRAYGTELEENAVNLVHGFLGLQDSYDIEGFEEKRQAALIALVACCPRKAAPTLIEEIFRNQYSTNQRYVTLNALAVGARELASMPLPPNSYTSKIPADRLTFPSKRLPPAMHKKYVTAGDQMHSNDPVRDLLDGISREAIERGKEATEDKVPAVVRERQLRVRQTPKVSEMPAGGSSLPPLSAGLAPPKTTTFTDVAAECFICPLVNRFWLFLRDEQAREARTMHQPALHRYRGAGTGLVLNAMVLSRMLGTLAVLVHAARHAKEWLAIIAPDALELAVTLGTRPVSVVEGDDDDDEPDEAQKGRGKDAALLTAALELALIVLDGSLELDEGRSLGLEHTALLFGAEEWAKEVFSKLESGVRTVGEGGEHEVRLRRAAAGVLLKVDELTSKWRRSMIDFASL
ncbi:hypothetical protein POSPLADRAFT_1044368 [Postia placenta MAD-698-R-SB12]|uniref:Telomere length regulation protein conserved domain-containing protein n=1 Tax=Postia placenta MAD-698-R-SB12 TaxID=670580 RepID=A0A1X6N901_9APHY|nr:hypothetical protein POSPLADRAFT_1044368 [Postia placenta MAD-698-R-SB12]OSX64936.1 hypothetical protein POSPLADRAFT_1044368 [Postia placenta MAD-698-R-SB12]